jgi:DNA-binding GntR family transcriptional regulator
MVGDAAAELGLSTTPVREALSRLVGEGLLEDRRRQGFFVPMPSAYELADLYSLAELCLTAALKARAGRSRPAGTVPAMPCSTRVAAELGNERGGDPAAAVFAKVLERSSNAALIDAGTRAVDRLAAPRLAEKLVLHSEPEELAGMAEALERGDFPAMAVRLRAYHRIRRARAEEIAYILANAFPTPQEYIPDIV